MLNDVGTNNLTIVYSGGKPVVAQYGQYDGYPSGQGAIALSFARRLNSPARRAVFQAKLERTRFVTDTELDDMYRSVGVEGGWLTTEQAQECNRRWPFFDRRIGAKVLNMISEAAVQPDSPLLLINSMPIIARSWCEYAYVLDMDRETLEAYRGYTGYTHHTTPLNPEDRFYALGSAPGAYPPRIVGRWTLDALPTQSEMAQAFEVVECNDEY